MVITIIVIGMDVIVILGISNVVVMKGHVQQSTIWIHLGCLMAVHWGIPYFQTHAHSLFDELGHMNLGWHLGAYHIMIIDIDTLFSS